MPLVENTLFGEVNRVEVALERLRTFCPPEGYYVADSGGKDSEVVYDLVHRAGVLADYHHSLTTVDHPATVQHIRRHHPDTQIHRPEMPLLQRMVEIEKVPPTRIARWCCRHYKERGGDGRTVVTGVRAAESSRRAGRRMVEQCRLGAARTFLHPIIDWSEADVWEYIESRGLVANPLYARGYRRIGCILCPMSRETERDRQACPKLYEAWHRAVVRCWERRVAEGRPVRQASGEEFWRWWLDRDTAAVDKSQADSYDLFEQGGHD